MDFIAWIVLGLLAGSLAKMLMPGDQKEGCFMTILLGIVGALVGGWMATHFDFLPERHLGTFLPSLGSIVTATVGALVLLFIFSLFKGKK